MNEDRIIYILVDRDGSSMDVIATIDGKIIGKYKGYYDGNVVALYIKQRLDRRAPGKVLINPLMLAKR